MRELNEAAAKAMALFGANKSMPISGNWVKWYHEGIPDEPEDEREKTRNFVATQGHCKECTALSGCYFIDGVKTFPIYPHHPNCHCEKQDKSPDSVVADCKIEKFTAYIFSDKYAFNGKRALFENDFGFTIDDSSYLKAEFDKQAKEKYIVGDYVLGRLNKDGQRINIDIKLSTPLHGEVSLTSGWMIRPNGLITCNTPYGGRK